MIRLSVDIGGTFTDLVLDDNGVSTTHKVLTTPDRPEQASMQGIVELLERSGRQLHEVHSIIHGTTLATNALIERKGARVAFVTTSGFRDVLEMRYEKRFDQYDLNVQLPEPLVPRDLRLTVDERMCVDGSIMRSPQPADVDALAETLLEVGVEAVAIGFLHAYANLAHERFVAERLSRQLPSGVTVCLSSEVSPEAREYDRFSTVCANAYVRPLMSRYLSRFDTALRDAGFDGAFFLMLSGGGLTTLDQARKTPIRLVESGPAGGVCLAAHVARQVGSSRTLAFDLGGTTAKICFLQDCEPQTTRKFEVARAWRDAKGSGLPIRVPTIEMVEIGAGGGSIARVDPLRRIRVGPESAGASPGPCAYQLGGDRATVTDANIVTGRIAPDGFAGGTILLDPDTACSAISNQLAEPLGLTSPQAAAIGIVEMADEIMANAARVHSLELGLDVTEYDLVVSGGGGALHATRIADKLSIDRIIVPQNAGVGSAIGFLHAPVAFERAQSVMRLIADIDADHLATAVKATRDHVIEVVRSGVVDTPIEVAAHVDLRYFGQGQEITLSFDPDAELAAELERLEQSFHGEYRKLYGFAMPEIDVELFGYSLAATARLPETADRVEGENPPKTEAGSDRLIYDLGQQDFRRYRSIPRGAWPVGETICGPAVVTEAQTTTIIHKGWTGQKLANGHLLLERAAR